ncbi:MAG: hypothetical protein RML46_12700, partial [Anaerolineae bacterium]|nr:hypothetical protein [Anaerolineae bacterium]
SHVFSIYEMLSDLDDALHGRITLRRDSSVRYVTTFWELFRHIMRAVANGSDRVVIDGYYVSREEA